MNNAKSKILRILESGKGFYVSERLDCQELDRVWSHVMHSFKKNFKLQKVSRKCMLNVHLDPSSHKRFKTLSVFDRTLNKDMAFDICERLWLRELTDELGFYPIDAYGFGYPSFTWRLMRPGHSNDLRGLHRDAWFRYALNEPALVDIEIPIQLQTIKVWIALDVVLGSSGLLVWPGSQNNDFPGFSVIRRDGLIKPAVNETEVDYSKFVLAPTQNGSVVLFGEQLMHGGAPTNTSTSRVSLEFCLATPNQDFYQTFIVPNGAKTSVSYQGK